MHLHIDCSSGLSAAGLLAACCGLGVKPEVLEQAARGLSLPVGGNAELRIVACSSASGHVWTVKVALPSRSDWNECPAADLPTPTADHFDPGRFFGTAERVLTDATAAAAEELRTPPEDLVLGRFLEPAEWLCSAVLPLALRALGVTSSTSSPIPVPEPWGDNLGPGCLPLLTGLSVTGARGPPLRITPLGIAWIRALAPRFRPLPAMELAGTGAGFVHEKEEAAPPGAVRLLLGTSRSSSERDGDLWILEANLDDLSPEITATLIDTSLAAGARDAWLTPILMKKGRAAQMLSVLVTREAHPAVEETIFRHSSTLGIRSYPVERHALRRTIRTVQTPWGPVRVKVGEFGDEVLNCAPEYEDCRYLAAAHEVPLKRVYAEALAAVCRTDPPHGATTSESG